MNKKQEIKNRIDLINKGEIPEGYKKYHGFVHPIDWKHISFNKIFKERCIKVSDTSKYPLYSLTIENGVIPKTEQYERSFLITKDEDSYKVVKNNDFVYNPMNLRFGAIARYKDQEDCSVSGYYNVFSIINSYNPYFMESFVKSQAMLNYYNTQATGSLIEKQRVHFSQFIEFNFALPSEKEQEKIAEILSCCDKVIELKENLLDEKNNEKKCLINRLLEKDLNNNKKFKKYKLSDFGDFYRGHSYSEFDVTTDITQLAVLRSNNIQKNTLVFDELQYVTKKCNNELLLRDGDIIICMSNGSKNLVGKVAKYYGNYNYPITAGAFCAIYRSRNKISLYLFQTNQYRKALHIALAGTNINNIKSSDIEDIEFWLPINEIDIYNIYNILNKKDKEIDLLEQELEQYKQLKKSLSQLLLTGIVRVNEV